MKDIAIVTTDHRLVEKVRLMLLGEARVLGLYDMPVSPDAYDKLLFDLRGDRRAPRLVDEYTDDFDIARERFMDDGDELVSGVTAFGSDYTSDSLTPDRDYPDGIVIEWREEARGDDLPYPFTYKELRSAIEGEGKRKLRLYIDGERVAKLDAREIKLTEVEAKLLQLLIEGGGEFVCREVLAKRVWGEGVDGGVLNVYIHYLREKLEIGGEKIILSSRKGGYRIDKKYLGGEDADAN